MNAAGNPRDRRGHVSYERSPPIRALAATSAVAAILLLLLTHPAARAASHKTLAAREQRQRATLRRDAHAVAFFRRHPRLARTQAGRRALRRARAEIGWTTRQLRRTVYYLTRPANPWPSWWLTEALCVHRGEGSWHVYDPPYANGFQFMLSTWVSAGGSTADWQTASPREQLLRAWLVWRRDGGSWREWPTTSRACGLT